jgi:2-haloalkanoic acid dehalogenase type II
MMQEIAAVCLDLDDTLWAVGPAIGRAERAMADWLRVHCPRITERHDLESMRRVRAAVSAEFPAMRHDLAFLRREALRRHAREAGYAEQAVDPAFDVFYAARNQVDLFDDVLPALRRLGQRFRLMSLSNGNADLAVIGLSPFFEHAIGASEAGAAKPDARIFAFLLERAGLEPAQVLYVGDDPHADVAGARSAGMRAAWIDRFGRPWPAEIEPPAHRVSDLMELVELLD